MRNPDQLEAYDLLRLTSPQKKVLRDKVRRNQGTFEILAHAYFQEDHPNPDFPSSPEYRLSRDAYIVHCIESGYPLGILEEAPLCGQLIDRLSRLRGDVYFVPTYMQDPVPYIPDDYRGGHLNRNHPISTLLQLEAWNLMGSILHELDVKEVRVGGRELTWLKPIQGSQTQKDLSEYVSRYTTHKPAAARWLREGLVPNRCVGMVMSNLLVQGFDISVSPVVSPNCIEAI